MAQQADSTSVGITWYFTLSVGVSAACLYLLVFDVARLRCPGPAKLPCFHGLRDTSPLCDLSSHLRARFGRALAEYRCPLHKSSDLHFLI